MHSARPHINDQLADLMCQRVHTANKCYRVDKRKQTSVAASQRLGLELSFNISE